MIGSGIFASPKIVYSNSGSIGMGLIVWAGCGLLVVGISLCYTELGTTFQVSGGEASYLMKGFGPLMGFLYGWTAIWVIRPSIIAGVSIACASYILEPFYQGSVYPEWLLKLITASIIGKIFF